MDSDLKALEDKITRLIALFQRAQAENNRLRQELAQAQDEARQLRDNMVEASGRVQALLAQLPEDAA